MLGHRKKLQICPLFLISLIGFYSCSPNPSNLPSQKLAAVKPVKAIEVKVEEVSLVPIEVFEEESLVIEEAVSLSLSAPNRSGLKYPKALELAKEYQLEGQPFTTITTKKAETLMMVSFKLYGDYRLWMNIYHWNEDKLGDSLEVAKGTVLRIKEPAINFRAASGRPYFIKQGDSLSQISEKVYGKWKWWPEISKNNPRLVRDPNLIFAGFTLFYKPLEKLKRELASEP